MYQMIISDIQMEMEMLRIRIDDPYRIVGICIYLDAKGYEMCGLNFFTQDF